MGRLISIDSYSKYDLNHVNGPYTDVIIKIS